MVTFWLFGGHVLNEFLDKFWNSCWSYFGVTFGVLTESKSGPFFGKASAGPLEALWEVSWLSWGPLGRPGGPDL